MPRTDPRLERLKQAEEEARRFLRTVDAARQHMPKRIRLSRAKGWRLPEGAVKVDRSTPWGNPFDFRASEHAWTALAFGCRGDKEGRREASVKAYREWIDPGDGRLTVLLERQVGFKCDDGTFHGIAPQAKAGRAPTHDEIKAALAGKDLACWCPLDGGPCHADVLLEIANR